ncbi:hypothetical protein Hdeb2414_s0033g00719921 [Helianthus debilis subsp. tardiflorus]
MIERRLCRKRVLVLLDDVDDLQQLKKPNLPVRDPGVTKETEPDPVPVKTQKTGQTGQKPEHTQNGFLPYPVLDFVDQTQTRFLPGFRF